jgi:hypothetical protein
MMARIPTIIKLLWWLAVGYIPIALNSLNIAYRQLIGCPEKGDCYVQGSELLFSFDVTIITISILLWPVCIWFLGLNKIVMLTWSKKTKVN